MQFLQKNYTTVLVLDSGVLLGLSKTTGGEAFTTPAEAQDLYETPQGTPKAQLLG